MTVPYPVDGPDADCDGQIVMLRERPPSFLCWPDKETVATTMPEFTTLPATGVESGLIFVTAIVVVVVGSIMTRLARR